MSALVSESIRRGIVQDRIREGTQGSCIRCDNQDMQASLWLPVTALCTWTVFPSAPLTLSPVKVGSLSFDELVRYADTIVLAKVTRVELIHRPEAETVLGPDAKPYDSGWRQHSDFRFAQIEVLT